MKTFIKIICILVCLTAIGLFRLNELNQRPSDPAAFAWINKVEIYTLGLIMSVLGYPLYPEVAREHLMLYLPNDGNPKVIYDDFFISSPVVQKGIAQARKTGKRQALIWPLNTYVLKLNWDSYWESRVALAFNGGYLEVSDKEVVAIIPFKYPKRAFAPLISIPKVGTLGVQEGLFWVLQEEGWYHPGEIHWKAELNPKR
jgi:hypothetical protein